MVRARYGMEFPLSLIRLPPKKLPKPTPKVVIARPVTFWLARSVTVRKQYKRPISREPSNVANSVISTASNPLNVSGLTEDS